MTGAQLAWRYKEARGSSILVVVFSHARTPEGKFGLERLFTQTVHGCLFLNCPDACWYLGLEEQIDRAIDAAASRMDARRIIYYGASKGAFGALLSGLRRGDGEIYAFGPELQLGFAGSQSGGGLSPEIDLARAPDLAAAILGSKAQFPLHLIFGGFDAADCHSAGLLFGRDAPPNVRWHLLRSSHANHDHLYTLNIIRKLTRTFERELDREINERGLALEMDLKSIAAFAAMGRAFAAGHALDPQILPQLPAYEANPGMQLLQANIFSRLGEEALALATLEAAQAQIEADPILNKAPKRWRKLFPMGRVKLLEQSGAHAKADEVRRSAALTHPSETYFHVKGA